MWSPYANAHLSSPFDLPSSLVIYIVVALDILPFLSRESDAHHEYARQLPPRRQCESMNGYSTSSSCQQDSSFPALYADLPNYLAGLHSRYPPVCRSCQPAVDEALHKSDMRAQTEAWGSALSRGQTSSEGRSFSRITWIEVLVWRIRGLLFCIDATMSLGSAASSEFALALAQTKSDLYSLSRLFEPDGLFGFVARSCDSHMGSHGLASAVRLLDRLGPVLAA